MNEKMFNPYQLQRALSLVPSMSKKELAQDIGILPSTLSSYLSGRCEPCNRVVERLNSVFVFPSNWYYLPEYNKKTKCFSYDPNLSASKREKSKNQAIRDIVHRAVGYVTSFVSIPTPKIVEAPDLTLLRSRKPSHSVKKIIEKVTIAQRLLWSLGNEPIQNLTLTAEANGIYCTYLNNVDSFSFLTHDGIPVVVLDSSKSLVANRFDLARELGHIILHRDIDWRLYEKDSEFRKMIVKEAEYFAYCFLLPTNGFLDSIPEKATIVDFKRAKANWLTSIATMIERASDAERIENKISLLIRLSQLGWRNTEPFDFGDEALPREHAQFFNKLSSLLLEESLISLHKIHTNLGLNVENYCYYLSVAKDIFKPKSQDLLNVVIKLKNTH